MFNCCSRAQNRNHRRTAVVDQDWTEQWVEPLRSATEVLAVFADREVLQ